MTMTKSQLIELLNQLPDDPFIFVSLQITEDGETGYIPFNIVGGQYVAENNAASLMVEEVSESTAH